jgi:hypothetical protein
MVERFFRAGFARLTDFLEPARWARALALWPWARTRFFFVFLAFLADDLFREAARPAAFLALPAFFAIGPSVPRFPGFSRA